MIGACLRFIADLFLTAADVAEFAGNAEMSTPCALVYVALFASGHYSKGVFYLLIFTFIGLLGKEFVWFTPIGSEL